MRDNHTRFLSALALGALFLTFLAPGSRADALKDYQAVAATPVNVVWDADVASGGELDATDSQFNGFQLPETSLAAACPETGGVSTYLSDCDASDPFNLQVVFLAKGGLADTVFLSSMTALPAVDSSSSDQTLSLWVLAGIVAAFGLISATRAFSARARG